MQSERIAKPWLSSRRLFAVLMLPATYLTNVFCDAGFRFGPDLLIRMPANPVNIGQTTRDTLKIHVDCDLLKLTGQRRDRFDTLQGPLKDLWYLTY